ncbi:Zn-ribbon domain-containing OB-fold protein [Jatrophihabitans sp. DSM 45814]
MADQRTSQKLLPVPTPETAFYWEKAKAHELWLPHCDDTDQVFWYPRSISPFTGSTNISWIRASGRASLESYIINYTPAPGYEDETPYVIAFVKLEEGPRLTSNLVGVAAEPAGLTLGMPLEVTFEDRGDLSLPQFRPAGVAPGIRS